MFVDNFKSHVTAVQKSAMYLCGEAKRIHENVDEVISFFLKLEFIYVFSGFILFDLEHANKLTSGITALEAVPDMTSFILPQILINPIPSNITPPALNVNHDLLTNQLFQVRTIKKLDVPTFELPSMFRQPSSRSARMIAERMKISLPKNTEMSLHKGIFVLGGIQGDNTLNSITKYLSCI